MARDGFYVRRCPGFEHLTAKTLQVTTNPDLEVYTTHNIRIISNSNATSTNTPTVIRVDNAQVEAPGRETYGGGTTMTCTEKEENNSMYPQEQIFYDFGLLHARILRNRKELAQAKRIATEYARKTTLA